jgi:hypothetical protein
MKERAAANMTLRTKRTSVMITEDRHRALRKRLIDRGLSMSDWVEEMIDEELARAKREQLETVR